MTPKQIDTVTTALINLHTALDTYGPSLLAGAIPGIGWWAIRRQQRRARHRAFALEGIRRLEAYANHPGARQLHDDIHNQDRKEDQP